MYLRVILFGFYVSSFFFSMAILAQNQPPDDRPQSSAPVSQPAMPQLTLASAMQTAIDRSPVLMSARYRLDAADARSAARRDGTPNPELTVEAEDFLGGDPAHGVDALQVTTSLSQELELGKKASRRRQIRRTTRDVSAVSLELTRQNLLADVAMAFLDVLTQQERVKHAGEMVELAQITVNTVTAQVDAGRSTGMEQEKALVELHLAELQKKAALRDLDATKIRLAAVCGRSQPFFEEVSGDLNVTADLPALDDLLQRAQQHPELKLNLAQVRQQQAIADAEKANRLPNVKFDIGFRWNNVSSNYAMVAGVGVPIPLFDRNRGNINGAARDVARANSDAEMGIIDKNAAIATAYQTLRFELDRLKTLQQDISPRVMATFEAVAEGYRIGRFGYLDLLDAQRTMFEIQHMLLDALVKYQAARITLSYTAGIPVSDKLFTASNEMKQGD